MVRVSGAAARAAAVALLALALAAPALAVTKVWTNNAGSGDGRWLTASNWSPSGVPTASDDVQIGTDAASNYCSIDGTATANSIAVSNPFTTNPTLEIKFGAVLTIAAASTVATGTTIYFNNGNLAGNGNLTVDGTLTLAGGQLAGSGTLTIAGGAAFNVTGTANSCYLSRNTTNNGTITFGSTTNFYYLYTSSVVTNNGVIDFQADEDLWTSGGAGPFQIDNQSTGIIKKTAGTGTAALKPTITNASGGAIKSLSGTLALELGNSSGSLQTTAGTIIAISGTNYTLNSGATVTGAGKIQVNNTLTIASGADITVPNMQLVGGSSRVDGPGTLRIGTYLQWDGGYMSGGGLTVVEGTATAAITCANNYCYNDNRQISLGTGSTTTYTAGSFALYFYNGATLGVGSGATFDIQTDQDIFYGGGSAPSMTNSGTIQKTSGSGSFILNIPLTSSGTLSVTAGDLQFPAATTINGGSVFIATSSNFDITGSVFNVASAFTVNGTGNFRVTNGVLRVPTGVTQLIPRFNLIGAGAYVDGAGTLQISGASNWTAGNMGSFSATGGTTEVVGGATLTINGSNYTYVDQGRQLLNNGTITYLSPTFALYLYNSGDIVNNGTFDMQTDLGILISGTGEVVTNNSQFLKSGGTGAAGAPINAQFDNAATGTVTVTSGRLNLGGKGTSSGTFSIASGSYVQIASDYSFAGTPSVTGTGIVRVLAGNMIVPSGVTLAVPSLAFDGGYISGGGLLQLTGSNTWSNGTMGHPTYPGGTTELMAGATLDINPTTYVYLDQSRILTNNNVINYTAATYGLWIYNGSTLNNAGTFNYDSDIGIGVGGSGSLINNSGTILKDTGTGTAAIAVPLDNSGVVQADAGILLLGANGTHASGDFIGNGSGAVGFSAGTHSLDAASSLTGTGTILVSGGTINVAGSYNPTKLTVSSGTLNLNSNGSAQILNFSGGGVIGGTGTFTILDDSTWTGGTFNGTGTTIVGAGKTLTISATTNYCYVDTRTFTNNGTIDYTATTSNLYLYLYQGGTLNNAGTFNILNDQVIYGATSTPFNNSGTINKSGAGGTTNFYPTLNNTGSVTVSSGVLALGGNGTHTGSFTATSPGALAFAGGTHTVTGAGSFSGTGTLAITGATLTSSAAYTVGTLKITNGTGTFDANGSANLLDMTGGTLGGTGTLTLNNGGTWSGGTMSGTGSTVLPVGQSMTIAATGSYPSLDTRGFVNNGTVNYNATTTYLQVYNNALFSNANAFNLNGDQGIYGFSNGVFNNAGTFTRASGSGVSSSAVIFNNTGNVTAGTGTLAFTGNGTHTGTFSIASGATLNFSGGTHTATAGSISGLGTLGFIGGTATFSIPYTVGALNVAGGTATLDGNGSADAFTMSSGVLGGSGIFTANNGGTWTGGTMNGSGNTIIPATKTLTINPIGYCYVETRTLTNNGIINYAPASSPYLQLYNNGTLINTGALNLNSGTYLYASSGGTVNNTGTVTKSGAGTIDFTAILNNSGQVTVTNGTLLLTGGGTHVNGVFTSTAPGTIQFGNGTHTLSGAGSMGGTGAWAVSGGTTNVGVPYSLASLAVSNGTIDFNTNGSVATLAFSNGTIGGSGTISVTDNSTWTGGLMTGTGTTAFAATKTVTLGGNYYCYIDQRTVQVDGTMNYVAPTYYFQIYNNGTLNVTGTGTLSIQTDLMLYGYGGGTINNTGTISRTTGTSNVTLIYPVINNNGLLSVTTGGLQFQGGGTHNGTFTVTNPAVLELQAGTQTFNAPSTLGGTGRYRFLGGTATVNGTWSGIPIDITNGTLVLNTNGTTPSLNMTSSGVLGGSGNVTVTGDSTLGGGTLQGTGTLTLDTGVTTSMPGNYYVTLERPLLNKGTVNYTSPAYHLQLNGATITNDGTFDIQTALLIYAYGISPQFVNNGTLKKTAGTGTMQFYPPLSNDGLVQVASGTMYCSNTYVQGSGTTELVNNAILQTGLLDLNGGSLIGNGTVQGNVTSDGVVAPGASAGALTITGNYTQSATGDLNIELGGTTAGTQYDQLLVGGTATLDGDLNVSAINSFLPASGNTFQILTFTTRNSTDFANKNGLNLGSGTNLIPAYSATDLQLTTNSVQADMQIAMTSTPATVNNGGTFTYNITVANNGGSNASGVTTSGTLPGTVSFVSSAPAICGGAPLVCSFGTIPNGGNASVTITVQAVGSGSAPYSATVAASQFDPNGTNNTANATTTIVANADLSVSVTDTIDPVAAGSSVGYTIVVNNAGPDPATGVNVAVTPSAQLTFNSASAPCAGGFPCSLGSLAPGATVTINTSWSVSPTGSGTASLGTTISASSPTDLDNSDNSASQSTTIAQDADVQVVKSGPANVPPQSGSTVTYSIVITNNGPSNATSVNLDDPTPSGLTVQSITGDCAAFPCAIGTMLAGETKTVSVTYAIGGAVGTTYTNTATVTSGADNNASNNTSSVTTTISTCPNTSITAPPSVNGSSTGNVASVTSIAGATYNWSIGNGIITSGQGTSSITFTAGSIGSVSLSVMVSSGACVSTQNASVPIISADLVVTKTGPSSVSPVNASTAVYTINVTNNGPSTAANVTLSDPPVSGLTFVSATGACTSFPCALGNMASGASVSVQATYSFTGSSASQTVTNVASASSATTAEGNPGNNSGSATTVIAACPNVSISGPSAMEPGASNNASVTPIAGAAYSWSITNGTIDSGNGTSSIAFTAGSAGNTTLSVTVTAGQCTGNASWVIPVTANQADVYINKSAPGSVASGAQFVYTLTIGNNGPASAEDVSFSDTLPPGASFVSSSSASCSGTATITCNFGIVAAGATQTVTITVNAPQGPASLTNTAQITTTSADPVNVNNTSTVTTSVTAAPPVCPTTAPSLLSPADNFVSSSASVTFTWSLVANATVYELWIGPNAATLALAGNTSGNSLTVTLTGTNVWQVIAKAGSSCTPQASALRTVNVDDSVPPPPCPTGLPSLNAPADGATLASPVTFVWTRLTDAIEYELWLAPTGTPLVLAQTTTDNTLTLDLATGAYNWQVVARNAATNCPSRQSSVRSFTVAPQTATCEGTAQPVSPANGISTSNAAVNFQWTAVAGAAGYRVWMQTGAAAPEVLGESLGTSLTKVIEVGSHTWWVQTLFEGCPAHESAHASFTILAAQNCDGRGRPSLDTPANGFTTSNANVAFSWTAVTNAIQYELWLAPAGGVPTLIGTTAATSMTAEVAPGALEWFVRALFSGCPSTESDRRLLTYEPPPNCALDERPVLIAPAEGDRLAAPLTFDWNDVAGATGYELWIAQGNASPELVATTTASQATGINRPLGAGRWFVRAKFPQPCAALDSTDSRFVVIPQAAACSPLDAPVISAPGQISSGVEARVQWSFVPGATGYILELANDPGFTAPTTINTGESRQHQFELRNTTGDLLAVYVRVHAVDARCNPQSIGPRSETAIVYILPETGNDASALIGEDAAVEYTLTLGSEFAGQTFTATPTTSWITVTPSTGTVPAGGRNLTVTANTAGLPPGTNIGGVTITTSSAGRVRTDGTTTVTTPITINLVSPVTPTPKSTPPPDALVIPAVANADGINSHFQSDVRVSNTSAQVMKYQLSFIPTGEAGITAGRQTTFSIEPGRTVALDDILKSWFGTGTTNAIGTLEVRPLTEVQKSTSSLPVGALSNLVTFASSRTFNVTPGGTFGQYIPAIPFANFIGKAGGVLSLQQIAHSQQYRTNLGIVEGSGEGASLMIRVFNTGGQKLTEFPLTLNGGQHTQLNGFLSQHGVTSLSDGRVEIEVMSGNGKVTAYASVLDNETADPLLVSPVTLKDSGNTRWVMPGVADLDNGTANWQTDMRVFNAGSTAEQLTLSFYSMNGGEPKTATLTLEAGEVKQLDRILANTFGVTQNGGAVHVTSAGDARLIATARTYNQTTQGTYGQFISAVTPAEAVGVGSRPLQLLQVEESSRYRSNIGLAEVSGKPVTLEVSIVPPDAKFTASVTVTLEANQFMQIPSMLAGLGLGETYNARVTVRAIAGEGRATAYASVIDAKTNDPTYVPAQ